MGLFGSNKNYEMPPGNPKDWTSMDVKHWIKHIGMAKHKSEFRVLSGEDLLTLQETDVMAMCKQDTDAKYVWRMLLRLKGEPEPSKVAPAVAAKERAVQYLFQWAGEDSNIVEFREFLHGAGTVTVGLMAACDRMPTSILGSIVGLVFKVYKSSRDAQVNIYNCRILRYICVDLLRALHSAGTDKIISVPPDVFLEVKGDLEKALMLVKSCSKPGWLVRMAFAGRIDEEFSAIHEGLVDLLQENGMDDLYGHAKLPRNGDYTDCCEALQSVLKTHDADVRTALRIFADTGQGYDGIKTALSCDDEGLRSEMGYIEPALAVIDKMLPPASAASSPAPAQPPAELRQSESSQDAPATPPQDYQKYQPTKSEGITLQPHPALQEPGRQSEEAQSSQMHLDLRQVQVSKPKAVNVFELFLAFCNFGTRMETQEMDCAHFSKFCRDCKLIGKGLSSTDVDLLFTRVKSIGQRRIVYEEFVEALTVIAEKKNKTLKQLTTEVLAVGGPAMKATKASYTRLHDDKNTYTGVYARGGPTNVDERISLDKMVLRTDPKDFGTPRMVLSGGSSLTPRGGGSAGFTTRATSLTPRSGRIQRTPRVHASAETGDYNSKALNDSGKLERITPRGTPPLSARTNASKHSSPGSVPRLTRNPPPQGYDQQSPSARPPSAPSADYEVPWNEPDSRAELKRVYNSFAAFGHTHAKGSTPRDQAVEMENKQFVKLVRDAGLLGGSLNVTRLDIIFSKVKGKGLRKINFQGFEMALTLLSEERGYTLNQTYNAIVSTAGPQLNHVTTPEFVKYHDDKSMYTGVYSRGGPTSVDKRITLDKMVTRSDDVYHNSRTPRFVA